MTILKGNDLLNKNQCNALRGLAIIGIFLHNFCHWLDSKYVVLENEYNFFMKNSNRMWEYLTGGNIDVYLPVQFFSFFGHYGVPVFLFLSGFGLVMKYESPGSEKSNAFQFIIYQWKKLFRLMILGLLVSLFVYAVYNSYYSHDWWGYFVAQIMLFINLLAHPAANIIPGPYWFFGLMMEVYVIYRLVIYPFHNKNAQWRWLRWFVPVSLIMITWIIQLPLNDKVTWLDQLLQIDKNQELLVQKASMLRYMRYNAVVAMLPFCAGVLVGRYGFPKLPKWVLAIGSVLALVLLMLANLNYYAWLWGPLLVIIGSTCFVKLFQASSNTLQRHLDTIMKPLVWTGALSSCIFAVHSITRWPIFLEVLWKKDYVLSPTFYLWLLLYIALTLILAWGYQYYLKLYPKPKLRQS